MSIQSGQLKAALLASKDSRLIELAPGPHVWERGAYQFNGEVKIVSSDPANPSWFQGNVTLDKSANLTFEDVGFTGSEQLNRIYAGENLSYLNCRFHNPRRLSDTTGEMVSWGMGILCQGAKNLRVIGNTFRDLHTAVGPGSAGGELSYNDFFGMGSDCIQMGGGSTDLLIKANYATENNKTAGAHCDFIQFFCTGTNPNKRITVVDNCCFAEGDKWTQGIFGRVEYKVVAEDGSYTRPVRHENITILSNLMMNRHLHGISLSEVTNLIIEDNDVLHTLPTDTSVNGALKSVYIRAVENVTGSIRNNRSPFFSIPEHMDGGGNIKTPLSTEEERIAARDAWLAKFRAANTEGPIIISPPPPPPPAPTPVPPPPPPPAPVPVPPADANGIKERLLKCDVEVRATRNAANRALYAIEQALKDVLP